MSISESSWSGSLRSPRDVLLNGGRLKWISFVLKAENSIIESEIALKISLVRNSIRIIVKSLNITIVFLTRFLFHDCTVTVCLLLLFLINENEPYRPRSNLL